MTTRRSWIAQVVAIAAGLTIIPERLKSLPVKPLVVFKKETTFSRVPAPPLHPSRWTQTFVVADGPTAQALYAVFLGSERIMLEGPDGLYVGQITSCRYDPITHHVVVGARTTPNIFGPSTWTFTFAGERKLAPSVITERL